MPRPAIASAGVRSATSKDLAPLYRLVAELMALSPTKKDRKRLRDAPEPTQEVGALPLKFERQCLGSRQLLKRYLPAPCGQEVAQHQLGG